MRLDAEYVLPLRWTDRGPVEELARYLADLVEWLDVTVVDGSAEPYAGRHAEAFPAGVRHLRVHPGSGGSGGNGKVHGVLTGLAAARHECVIIADDDVRYDRHGIERVLDLLHTADLVRPQNYFDPLPWHARWDTGRTLLNRALGSDFPGTLGVRRTLLLDAGGYSAEALFENLELIRTVVAAGGRQVRADDLFVRRIPCSFRHFARQRVRQAYDSFAQPGRLAVELGLLPALLLVRRTARPPRTAALAALAVVLVAESGRRRRHGAAVFPAGTCLWAPLWVLERAVASWLAVVSRARGGVGYAGGRMRLAAHSVRQLRARIAADSAAPSSPSNDR